MKRARVIIKEISITKQGEVHHFQIKLPKNAIRICAIDTDFLIVTPVKSLPTNPVTKRPFLKWEKFKNPTLGRLKLQSSERTNIFYSDWVKFKWLNGGLDDMSYGLFPISPYSLNKPTVPKTVEVPNTTTVINGLFTDTIGILLKQPLAYKIKVFMWIETQEESDGVVFDFQTFVKY